VGSSGRPPTLPDGRTAGVGGTFAGARTTAPTTDTHTPDPRRRRALTVTLAAGFMSLLDVSIVSVALPSLDPGSGSARPPGPRRREPRPRVTRL